MDTEHEEKFINRLDTKYRLIYQIGATTGLRISDIVKLKKSILDIKEPTIKEQKTGKSKRFYLPVKLRRALAEWCSCNQSEYIFPSANANSGHISRQAVFKHFKNTANALGLMENIGTHTMRKNYALKLLKNGKQLKYIKNKLNHDNLSDTLLYLMQKEV